MNDKLCGSGSIKLELKKAKRFSNIIAVENQSFLEKQDARADLFPLIIIDRWHLQLSHRITYEFPNWFLAKVNEFCVIFKLTA